MKKEEVIDWLMIMKANLNSFPPEVSGVRKIEALAEAIRLIKNERSIDKIDCDNADCNNCVNHKYCDYESNKSEIPTGSATKNDLGVREFEEIVVEYPPEDLCTYPEYKGKPYFSIKYKEGNDCFIGYGTYSPKVFSRFLRDYFMPSVTPQEPKIVPIAEIKFDEDKLKELVDKAVLTVSQSGVTEVLDKIRAEIEAEMEYHSGTGEEVIQAYADGLHNAIRIIDKYKAESEGKKW